jgi:hypothetical protein
MWVALLPERFVQAQGGACTSTVGSEWTNTCEQQCGNNNPSCLASCKQSRQSTCWGVCEQECSLTTGAVCCNYLDDDKGCEYGCGCPYPAPACSGAVCVGTEWSCASPILIDTTGNGFELTSPENGVWFDLAVVGHPQKWSWTSASAQDGFLALDRNGDGMITDGTELFGSYTPQPPSQSPNGFLALAVYDKPENGGNDDGFIDSRDAIYSKLRIWIDANHNGISEPNELHTLSEIGIARIDLQYQVSTRTDQYGNDFHYRGRVWDAHGNQGSRWAWDVYFHRDLNVN